MNRPPAIPKALSAGQLATGPGRYRGITVRETAGAAATVRLFDNTAGSGLLIATIGLAANGSLTVVDEAGVNFSVGVFCALTGTTEGSIFL
ncbi:MAG TPA: hypothetical protein VGM21_04030 [Actinomycetota bacterium]